jgi:hypothetical protein
MPLMMQSAPIRRAAAMVLSRCCAVSIAAALKDGFTTGKGMGLGLGGAKRLSNEFAIDSKLGAGTKITITRWK